MRLKSKYEVGEIPHNVHPCPQAERQAWLCLNGAWEFYREKVDGTKTHEGKILVPFSPETLLSGIEDFVLETGEKLVYTRNINVDKGLLLGKTLLRFGAVDSECTVFVNGENVGGHIGGFTAFALDVTKTLREGENEIKVVCTDEATRNHGLRGKQSDKRGGIWYTAQSGIWQTVWLESMPTDCICGLKITPNVSEKTVHICSQSESEQEIVVYDDGKEILRQAYQKEITLRYDFALWSPENPKLYEMVITNGAGDKVRSYFGVRSFGQTVDETGKARLTLNGKPYFFNGVLDQGYFSDGMLTYPSEQAIVDELTLIKNMGFNTLRKHIKIEPMRWYYHCDRLGIAVWQDFVNGGGAYPFMRVALLPFLGFKHKDNDYTYFHRDNEKGRQAFLDGARETVEQLYNCTCIALWTVFNEGWGQFDSQACTALLKTWDNTRIIDSVSGWYDQGVDKTTLKSLHTYYTPLKVPKDNRPVVLSEFGGYSLKVDGHVFAEDKEFGYKKFRDSESLVKALKKLYLEKLLPLIKKGLCGCIYTQVSDVEEEINGFVTYDRAVCKVPVSQMAEINAQINAEAEKVSEKKA